MRRIVHRKNRWQPYPTGAGDRGSWKGAGLRRRSDDRCRGQGVSGRLPLGGGWMWDLVGKENQMTDNCRKWNGRHNLYIPIETLETHKSYGVQIKRRKRKKTTKIHTKQETPLFRCPEPIKLWSRQNFSLLVVDGLLEDMKYLKTKCCLMSIVPGHLANCLLIFYAFDILLLLDIGHTPFPRTSPLMPPP